MPMFWKTSTRKILAIAIALASVATSYIAPAYSQATQLPPGMQCFQATTGITGMIGTFSAITGGSGGVSGTYTASLTGGRGSNATATFTVVNGAVTALALQNPGSQYALGDFLSASPSTIGGVSGFSVFVTSTSINSSLAGGTVGMYVSGSLVTKQTWQDAAQTLLNTNPIALDSNGCALIYGIGTYRQILSDSLGNVVWDRPTTAVQNVNPFYAGLAGGTANTITITDPGFGAVDGQSVQFVALNSNTGPVTLNPSGFGTIPVLKNSSTGTIALALGDIYAGNTVNATYVSSAGSFIVSGPPTPVLPMPPQLGGAIGLTITNGAAPSVQLALKALKATIPTLATNLGAVYRSNVSLTINVSTTGLNGLDTGALTPSTWYNVWLIDNGTTTAGLFSLSATSPSLPSGYTYALRLGAVRVDAGSNLVRITQNGKWAQYTVTTGANTANLPIMASGISGAPATPTWVAVALGAYVPPTATRIATVLHAYGGTIIGAPNPSYGAASSNTNPPPCGAVNSYTTFQCEMNLESSNVYWASDGTGGVIAVFGWADAIPAE